MTEIHDLRHIEQLLEKIIFNENELERLKIAIKNSTEGKTSARELKQLILQCRGRILEDITAFIFFIKKAQNKNKVNLENNHNQPILSTDVESQLREKICEKNELLETVAQRVNSLVNKLNNENTSEV
jgi:hypothetical protein